VNSDHKDHGERAERADSRQKISRDNAAYINISLVQYKLYLLGA